MKKATLIFALLVATAWASAQTLDSIAHHVMGYYGPIMTSQWENGVQLRDGSILFNHRVGVSDGSGDAIDVGNVFYKISRHGAIILDTLFIEDSDSPFYTFAPNPNGDNNLRIGIVRDSVSGGSFLQILPFDNDLQFDSLNEVFVPVSDTLAFSYIQSGLITSQNDLVELYITFNGARKEHFSCFGLDGTLKHENTILSSSLPITGITGWGVFNESPLEYYVYGTYGPYPYVINCQVLDSLFQPKEYFTIEKHNSSPAFDYTFGWLEKLLVDGDDFIFGCRYKRGAKNGVCLAKYDKRTHEQKNVLFFESRPMIYDSGTDYGACPIGLGKDSDGDLYFSYNTQQPWMTDKGQVAVVKLDADLNVQWERFCLEPEGYYKTAYQMAVLDDGGVAIPGTYLGTRDLFFLILSDEGWAVTETEIQVRPYMFYPNPVQDELYLQYSPDVTPTQIDLYDLQGRLVRTQKNGLERLEMNGLPAGTYTMRVTLEGGKVFVDKVVKE